MRILPRWLSNAISSYQAITRSTYTSILDSRKLELKPPGQALQDAPGVVRSRRSSPGSPRPSRATRYLPDHPKPPVWTPTSRSQTPGDELWKTFPGGGLVSGILPRLSKSISSHQILTKSTYTPIFDSRKLNPRDKLWKTSPGGG